MKGIVTPITIYYPVLLQFTLFSSVTIIITLDANTPNNA